MSQQPTFRTNRSMASRTNKYAAQCERCLLKVEAEQGVLTYEGGSWVVRHAEGRCGVLEETPAPVVAARPVAHQIPEGRYTVTFADGTYKTLRAERQAADADFMPGRIVLSYLSGSNNDADYTSFAHALENGTVVVWKRHQANESLREALKVLIGSPQAAAKAYAEHSGNCFMCGRTLTTPESIKAGVGPTCAGKVAW